MLFFNASMQEGLVIHFYRPGQLLFQVWCSSFSSLNINIAYTLNFSRICIPNLFFISYTFCLYESCVVFMFYMQSRHSWLKINRPWLQFIDSVLWFQANNRRDSIDCIPQSIVDLFRPLPFRLYQVFQKIDIILDVDISKSVGFKLIKLDRH